MTNLIPQRNARTMFCSLYYGGSACVFVCDCGGLVNVINTVCLDIVECTLNRALKMRVVISN